MRVEGFNVEYSNCYRPTQASNSKLQTMVGEGREGGRDKGKRKREGTGEELEVGWEDREGLGKRKGWGLQ